MKTINYLLVATVLGVGLASVGCSSNSSCADGGACGGAGGSTGLGGAGGSAPVTYGLTIGTCQFAVLSQAPGAVDGCDIGVEGAVGHSFPVVYDMTNRTVQVGNEGSLGIGIIDANMASLSRVGDTSDVNMPTCTWHQTDTSTLTMTGTNAFTLSVVETQSGFAAACTAPPLSGSCSSSWTWNMAIVNDATVNARPTCGGP